MIKDWLGMYLFCFPGSFILFTGYELFTDFTWMRFIT